MTSKKLSNDAVRTSMESAERHEHLLVKRFVLPTKQARLTFLLNNRIRRARGLDLLAHYRGVDPRWSRQIPKEQQEASILDQLLRRKGSPNSVYVISEDSSADGTFLPLTSALDTVVNSFMGAFISCRPGELAYFQTEAVGERFLLERSPLE